MEKQLRMGQLKQHINLHQNTVILMEAETFGYITQGALSWCYYHRCYLRVIIMIVEKTVHLVRKAQGKQKGVGGKG